METPAGLLSAASPCGRADRVAIAFAPRPARVRAYPSPGAPRERWRTLESSSGVTPLRSAAALAVVLEPPAEEGIREGCSNEASMIDAAVHVQERVAGAHRRGFILRRALVQGPDGWTDRGGPWRSRLRRSWKRRRGKFSGGGPVKTSSGWH